MAGEIAQGVPAAPRPVGDGQPLRGEGIGHPDRQVAGVALLAVRAEQGEDQPVRPRLLHLPHLPVKACQAAVDVVFPVVGRQGILPPAQGEAGPADAVGHPAHQGPQILILPPVVLQTVKAQRHIHGRSAPAGHCEGAHRPPIGQDPGGEPAAAQRDLLHLCPVRHRAEGASAPFFHTGLLSTRLRAAPAAVRRRVFAPLYRVFPPEARRLAPLLPGRAVSSRFFLRFSP